VDPLVRTDENDLFPFMQDRLSLLLKLTDFAHDRG
jgi:hypothetical protein